MSADSERLAEIASELSHRLQGVLSDVIPADAQAHLVNAQKELLIALFLIYEHQVSGRRRPAGRRDGRRPKASERTRTRPAPRIERIPIE